MERDAAPARPAELAGRLLAAAAAAPTPLDAIAAACVAARDAWGAERVSVWLLDLPARTTSPVATSQDHDELQEAARRWTSLPLADAPAFARAADDDRDQHLDEATLAQGLPAALVADFGIRSLSVTPMHDGEVRALLCVEPPAALPVDPSLTQARHGFALLTARLVAAREARRRAQQLDVLVGLAEAVAEGASAGETLTGACEDLSEALGAQRASVWLVREGRPAPVTAGYADGRRNTVGLNRFRSAEAPEVVQQVLADGVPRTLVGDELTPWWREEFDLGSILVVPIGLHPDVEGVLVVDRAATRRFGDDHVRSAGAVAANLATLLRLVRLSQLREHELEELRHASEVKNVFLSAVSHELRTPLTVILGLSETLHRRAGQLDAETSLDLTARLHDQAERLERLLLDLLDVNRLVRERIEPERVATDVADLVRRVVAGGDHPGHTVVLDLVPAVARVDASQVERIVDNLLGNACKYSPTGTQVRVRTRPTADGVRIEVLDRGPGVPEDQRERVFEPFHRIDEDHPRPGTGVGLALVAKFAELHGGSARVVDRDGGGAYFVVELRSRSDER